MVAVIVALQRGAVSEHERIQVDDRCREICGQRDVVAQIENATCRCEQRELRSVSKIDDTTQIIRTNLLEEGEKVRHNSERLASIVLACRQQACSPALLA